jgi:hypothetical protein
MNKIQQFEIRNEVKEKLGNSLEMFNFWQIIDCCELEPEQIRWAKEHLTWDVRFCTSQEVEANIEELKAEDDNQIVMEYLFKSEDQNE